MSNRAIIATPQAPAAIGPYSQAVKVGNTVWLSGQIPLDPESMTVVEGDISVQADQVFKNLAAVASASGGSLDDAVKIKNTDISSFLKLPPVKLHCSMLAEEAIKAAVRDYKKK